jgi:SAM-dependent methyltransferase/glycosyltransferase involved in cell wall biosynthesis
MDAMRRHFDAISDLYYETIDAVWYDNRYYHESELAFVREIVRSTTEAPACVLDAGCGPGRHAIELAGLGYLVSALDFSEGMLTKAGGAIRQAQFGDRIRLVQGDVRRLPFRDETFDAVVCMEVLEHLPDHLRGLWDTLSEFRRTLRPGGLLLLSVPLISHEQLRVSDPYLQATWKEAPAELWSRYKNAPLATWRHFDAAGVAVYLERAGFAVKAEKYVRVIPAGLIERYPMLATIDKCLEEHPIARRLAREVLFCAERRERNEDGIAAAVHFRLEVEALVEPSQRPYPLEIGVSLKALAETLRGLEESRTALREQVDASERQIEAYRAAAQGFQQAAVALRGRLTVTEEDLRRARESSAHAEKRSWNALDRIEQNQRVLQTANEAWEADRRELRAALRERDGQIEAIRAQFQEYFQDKEGYIAQLRQELARTRRWSLVRFSDLAGRGTQWILRRLKRLLVRLMPARLRTIMRDFRLPLYFEPEPSDVIVYSDEFRPHFLGRDTVSLLEGRTMSRNVHVSLVATVRNEERTARVWLESIASQTRLPDEVIVVDGGSSDNTVSVLEDARHRFPFELKVIRTPGSNIAEGKNLGIRNARHDVIVHTDFGCDIVDREWLEKLVAPFEIDPLLEVVAGWYESKARSLIGRTGAIELIPSLSDIEPRTFLPSTRSIAFTKDAAMKAGGYPEWLTLTAEDTYFALELKRVCAKWAFVPDAKVLWHAPERFRDVLQKARRWSSGDGEAGLFPDRYMQLFARGLRCAILIILLSGMLLAGAITHSPVLVILAALLVAVGLLRRLMETSFRRKLGLEVWLMGVVVAPAVQAARLVGFVEGVRNRPRVFRRRYRNARGLALLLSGVPFADSGGGQRGAQLAKEFLRRGFLVVFVNKFPSHEHDAVRVRHSHPFLLTFPIEAFDIGWFAGFCRATLDSKPLLAIVEFPLKDFISAIAAVRSLGGTIIYDRIDDWATSLGGDWYSIETERDVALRSDILIATAPSLAEGLKRLTERGVAVLPNAVDTQLFMPDMLYPRPEDLPPGDFTMCYVGALWGEWFDWVLLRKLGEAYPAASIVLVGDRPTKRPNLPPNVHLLGLKPQAELPPYLAHCDVAIIPWKATRITHATSPLKVYEYLAMGKPVVAPKLRSLEGIPCLWLSEDHSDFIRNVERTRQDRVDGPALREFVCRNSWQQRVSDLLAMVMGEDAGPAAYAGPG